MKGWLFFFLNFSLWGNLDLGEWLARPPEGRGVLLVEGHPPSSRSTPALWGGLCCAPLATLHVCRVGDNVKVPALLTCFPLAERKLPSQSFSKKANGSDAQRARLRFAFCQTETDSKGGHISKELDFRQLEKKRESAQTKCVFFVFFCRFPSFQHTNFSSAKLH